MVTRKVMRSMLAAAGACLLAAGCSGHAAQPGEAANGETGLSRGLPALAELKRPGKQLSVAGPGYFPVGPLEAISWDNALPGAGGSIVIQGGASSLGFALYGVWGFDGDNGPTSARVTVGDITGSYYVAFSDYVAGSWAISGPFNATAVAEIRLPDGDALDEYTSATAFTSPAHAAYFAVIAPAGSSVQVKYLDLGVQGGQKGPKLVYADGRGGANGFYLNVALIRGEFAPDFAGFIFERAPLFSGDFTALPGMPVHERHYRDESAALGTVYRYRVAAVDVSGNRSPWYTFQAGPTPGGKAAPIARLKAPRGPLRGASTVTFDLSDSFDPEGAGFAKYMVVFGGAVPETYEGTDPSVSVRLAPGCYLVLAAVETSDGRSDETFWPLKIYPAWDDAPVRVAEAQTGTGMARLKPLSLGRYSASGRLIAAGSDYVSAGLDVWSEPEIFAMGFAPRSLPLLGESLAAISEPLELQGSLYFAYNDTGLVQLAQCGEGGLSTMGRFITGAQNSPVALATDGATKLWLAYVYENAGTYMLRLCAIHEDRQEYVVQDNIGTPYDLDAVYNPAAQKVDLLLSSDIGVEWLRWDPTAGALDNSAIINGASSGCVDLELNPATGRPAALFAMGFNHMYCELTAAEAWTPQEIIDNSLNNRTPADMEFGASGIPCAYFALNSGQARLYQRNAPGVWNTRNTPAAPANSGFDVDLVGKPGTDDFTVADSDVGGNIHLIDLAQNGTCAEVWHLDSSEGLGRWLSGAAGTSTQTDAGPEELHASTGTLHPFATTHHYISTDQGQSWVQQNDIGLLNTQMAASKSGYTYLTGWSAGANRLDLWSPLTSTFTAIDNLPAQQEHAPTIHGERDDDPVMWFSYDHGATSLNLKLYVGDALDASYAHIPEITPIWAGTQLWINGAIAMACLAGGASADDADVYTCDQYSGKMDLLTNLGGATGLHLNSHYLVEQRQLASAYHLGTFGADEGSLFWLATQATAVLISEGNFFQSLRYNIDESSGRSYTALPFEDLFSLYTGGLQADIRRTTSMMLANGETAVGLVASLDGKETYFAWSDFGGWEELPLPPGVKYMNLPQLVPGRDGTWYMFYHNWKTDEIMCLRTRP